VCATKCALAENRTFEMEEKAYFEEHLNESFDVSALNKDDRELLRYFYD
jgi:hypothetical protein